MREYQAIETMQKYLQLARRRESASWTLDEPVSGGIVPLTTAGVTIDLDERYDLARFPFDDDWREHVFHRRP